MTAAISAMILTALTGAIRSSVSVKADIEARHELLRRAEFAMDRMVRAVANSERLLLPLADDPATDWPENVREETVPASPPTGSSTHASAVLAVTLPAYSDLDFDGFADADNDRDDRLDEDFDLDATNDLAAGIAGIDDDGDGSVDDLLIFINNDDEDDALTDEDLVDGIDNDGDGSVDEDPPSDSNADGCAGLCGVDDDGDGQVDEGGQTDDDEDGASGEDWFDAVVFYLGGDTLNERTPVPWDQNGDGAVTGRDYLISVLTNEVTRLGFERVPAAGGVLPLIDISLELESASGHTVSLSRRVRVGGAL